MEKILKILKINLLSLIALPLLLVATASKLIAKALEKISVILGMIVITLLVIAAFECFKHPDNLLEFIATLVILFVFGFLIVMVCLLIMNVAAALIKTIYIFIISFFEIIYDFTYVGFLRLYAVCETDYQYIGLNGKKVPNALFCLFYTILHGVNKVIVTVVSCALPASLILSALLIIGSLASMHMELQRTFGIGLTGFIGKFDLFSVIYGIVTYIAVTAIFVVVLISLGIEWHEWAQELKMTGEELDENVRQLQESDWHLARSSEASSETGDAYLQNLEEHIDSLEQLSDVVESALTAKDNALLRSNWGNYFRNLSEIIDECAKYEDGIPLNKFKKLIPRIQQLEKQREDVKTLAEKLLEANRDPVNSAVFFSGCTNIEKLEKRYKSLCKAYHPDSEGGDTETFQKMQEEYTALKEHLQS